MTQTEQTVLLVKPEAVRYDQQVFEQLIAHEFSSIQRIGEAALEKIDAEDLARMLYPDADAALFKAVHDHFWNQRMSWVILTAPGAIEKLSRLVGTSADPGKCMPGTLRARFFSEDGKQKLLPSVLNDPKTGLNFEYHFNGFLCPRTEEERDRWFRSGVFYKTARAA